MASPPAPTEEERCLLREYRITTIPTRRKNNPEQPVTQTQTQSQTQPQPLTVVIGQQQQPKSQQPSPKKPSQPSHNQHQHHHHHHHHHNKHHGSGGGGGGGGVGLGIHHHHHGKRQKSTTPTHELTPDELSRMLELVSELNYLKLVKSPMKTTTINGKNQNGNNGNNNTSKNGDNGNKTQGDRSQLHEANITSDSSNNENTVDTFNNQTDCSNSTLTTNSRPYIFEKVDYIKKISIRRKALKKLKKAKNKSRVVSPNTAQTA